MKLTERQKQDLLKAYASGNDGWENLKTGWSLSRKGLVRLADTDKGVEVALEIKERMF